MMNKIKTNLGQFTALCLFYGLGLFWLYTAYDRIGNLFVTKSRYGTSKSWEWENINNNLDYVRTFNNLPIIL